MTHSLLFVSNTTIIILEEERRQIGAFFVHASMTTGGQVDAFPAGLAEVRTLPQNAYKTSRKQCQA